MGPRMGEGEPLTLTPIGVGTAYALPGQVQSCYLVAAGATRVCLDMGAGAMNRLQQVVDPADLDLLLVSHAHPDHCADLLALRVYMAYGPGRGRSVRTALPEGLRERLVAFAADDVWSGMEFEDLERPGGSITVGDLRLVHGEVPHTEPTHAVRVESGGRSLVYGADAVLSDALVDLARGCDVLVCEASFGAEATPPGAAHMNAREAGETARRAGAGRLLLTHCYPEFDRAAALAAASEAFGGPVAFAEQGLPVVV